MNLIELGWNDFFENQLSAEEKKRFAASFSGSLTERLTVARIIEEQKKSFQVHTGQQELRGELLGKIIKEGKRGGLSPSVGDWVLGEILPNENKLVIHKVLNRKTKFSRKSAGTDNSEQVVAANIDYAFIVSSLNQDLNVRRVERYITAVKASGAEPIILLTKKDLAKNWEATLKDVKTVSGDLAIYAISTLKNEGLDQLKPYFTQGKTSVFLGSSGIGKSTLTNALLGNSVQEVKEVREEDDKGKHTTTFRKMFFLPSGGLIIDTPGMREVQLWEGEEGMQEAFDDIETLALKCKFSNCQHNQEPSCAVQMSIQKNELSLKRLQNYHKLHKEIQADVKNQYKSQNKKNKKS